MPAAGRDTQLAGRLTAGPGDRYKWVALANTTAAVFMSQLDGSIVIIALPAIATTAGVGSTARSAYDHGYHVVLATDAMTDTDAAAHQGSIERRRPARCRRSGPRTSGRCR